MIRVQFETDQDEAVWWWLRGRNARWLGEDVRALAAEMPAGEARRLFLAGAAGEPSPERDP
jgi:hypothetical protein